MSVQFNIVLSDDLNQEIDSAVDTTGSNKSEVLRKALQLYLSALQGAHNGLRVGRIDPNTKEIKTEIIGL